MMRRILTSFVLIACLAAGGCRTNQGNGEANPENSGNGHSPDNQKNDMRKAGRIGNETKPSNPGPDQSPGQPAGRTDRPHH